MDKVIIAKCITCGSTREIRAGEIEVGSQPVCEKDLGIMLAERTELREDFI